MSVETEDTSKKIEKILADFERKNKQEEWILKPYDSIRINGVILVDGNHCFLEAVNAFQLFNKSVDKDGLLSKVGDTDIPNIYHEIMGKHLANFMEQSLMKLTTSLSYWASRAIAGDGKELLDRRTILKEKPSSDNTILVDHQMETYIFDARLPPVKETIDKLERQWNAAHKRHDDSKLKNVQAWMDIVKVGMWKTFHEGHHLEVRYELKDEFLDKLVDSHDWRAAYGRKHINIANNGQLYQKEKGVDTLLVIKGCEIAERSDVDFVCVVTNDSDYEPLIEHIKSKGKDVYLYSAGNHKRISRRLKDAVGQSKVITVKDVMSGFRSLEFNKAFSNTDIALNPSMIQLLGNCLLHYEMMKPDADGAFQGE